MLFRREYHDRIARGEVTLTFRRWTSARVRAEGRYRLDAGSVLVVDEVGVVRADAISDDDARRAGYEDRASLWRDLGIARDGDTLYRVAFRYERAVDERLARAADVSLDATAAAALMRRLTHMDAAAIDGPWTLAVLELIERSPRVAAAKLAAALGQERLPFKARVRRLKELGLTLSFEVGYELSPRGRALLDRMRGQRGVGDAVD
jgi:hypothetical protein